MKKEPDKYYKCIKVPLKSIIRHKYDQNIILENVNKATKIYNNALQIIKLYYLCEAKEGNHIIIDLNLALAALKVVCIENNKEQKDEIKVHYDKMLKLYKNTYSKLNIFDNLDYDGLATLFQYLAIEIVTNFENNVKARYYDYIVRFINTFFAKKQFIEEIKSLNNLTKDEKNKKTSSFCKMLRNIIKDILNVNIENKKKDYKSAEHLHSFIDNFKKIMLPNKNKYKEDNVMYDLKVYPEDYFKCMFKISKLIELYGGTLFNLFPQRTSVIPKHIKLDSTTIVNLLFECDKGYYKTNLVKENRNIWDKVLKLHLKVFRKKGYLFNNSIITDGVSCSILFIKENFYGKQVPSFKPKNCNSEKYIDELNYEDYDRIIEKKIIAIDPNKGDLLYCIDDTSKERNFYRYTQDQRRKETKMKKYQKIREELKEEKIDGKTIKELEKDLNEYNGRTLEYDKYIEYLKIKNEKNKKLWDFYQKEIFRKLNLNTYLNTLRSEQRIINKMTEVFGKPKESVICIGDWDQSQQMKFKEPTKGKGFRELLKKYGYEVYLVDEYNTSKKCSSCEGINEKFMIRPNPRPYRKGNITVHGLLRCNSCEELWNRDENSSINILILAMNAIAGFERPEYLKR
jgi:transposase